MMKCTRESIEVIKQHLGKMEIRNNEVWMCVGGIDSGLTWRKVLTEEQLWEAVENVPTSDEGS